MPTFPSIIHQAFSNAENTALFSNSGPIYDMVSGNVTIKAQPETIVATVSELTIYLASLGAWLRSVANLGILTAPQNEDYAYEVETEATPKKVIAKYKVGQTVVTEISATATQVTVLPQVEITVSHHAFSRWVRFMTVVLEEVEALGTI